MLGEIKLLDVLQVQRRSYEIQQDILDTYEEYYHAASQLEAVVGRDIWPDEHHQSGEQ